MSQKEQIQESNTISFKNVNEAESPQKGTSYFSLPYQNSGNSSRTNPNPNVPNGKSPLQLKADNSPQVKNAMHWQTLANNSPQVQRAIQLQKKADNSPQVIQAKKLQALADNSPQVLQAKKFQDFVDNSPRMQKENVIIAQMYSGNVSNRSNDNFKSPSWDPDSTSGKNNLPPAIQAKMQNSFGHDLSDVNVFPNSDKPSAIDALAFTQGKDIHFAPGQYNPESQKGQELLGHELTHVVQQKKGRVNATTQMKGVNVNDSPELEKEADEMGKKAAKGEDVSIKGVSPQNLIQKQETDNPQTTPVVEYINLPEVSTSLTFSVGAPKGKYKEGLINFVADVRYVQNRLKELGLLSEEDYSLEYPEAEELATTEENTPDVVTEEVATITSTNTSSTSNTTATITPGTTTGSNSSTEENVNRELTDMEKQMLQLYNKVGVGTQVASSSIPKTIYAIRLFQREVKHGGEDGRIDFGGPTAQLFSSISKEDVIKRQAEYERLKQEKEELRKKEEERKKKEEESRKKEEERIKKLKNTPTDDDSIEKIIDKYDNEGNLACYLVDFVEHNPTLVIKALDASDYSDQDDIAFELMKILSDPELGKLSKDLLEKLKECLVEGWTDDEENKEVKRIEKLLNQEDQANESESKETDISKILDGNIKSTFTVSLDTMKQIFPNAKENVLTAVTNELNKYMSSYGINSKLRLAHFLAQTGHETGGFNKYSVSEDLYYTTAERIEEIFPKYFKESTGRKPKDYIKNPQKLANVVYSNRMGNGSESSGEGYKYRGRGSLQLTGKDNYIAFGKHLENKLDFVKNPDLISDNVSLSVLSALWYFNSRVVKAKSYTFKKIKHTFNIDNDDILGSTVLVNGGDNGLEDRKSIFKKAKSVLGI